MSVPSAPHIIFPALPKRPAVWGYGCMSIIEQQVRNKGNLNHAPRAPQAASAAWAHGGQLYVGTDVQALINSKLRSIAEQHRWMLPTTHVWTASATTINRTNGENSLYVYQVPIFFGSNGSNEHSSVKRITSFNLEKPLLISQGTGL